VGQHSVNVSWNRCKGEQWADLWAVDLTSLHFNGMQGVYAAWHGGATPTPVAVGQGELREELEKLRADPRMQAFRPFNVFVTWARAESVLCDGIERFLLEALRPKIARPPPNAPIVQVNLPGRDPLPGLAAPKPEPSQPDQVWDDLTVKKITPQQAAAAVMATANPGLNGAPAAAAQTATPKARKASRLQAAVKAILERRSAPKSGGFFGGSKPKDEKEGLVNEVMNAILEEAVGTGASDIHIEPMETATRVRLRVDGMLDEALVLPSSLDLRLVSYIRVACNLDPEKGIGTAKPEDGRMNVTVDGHEADLRLSTFPTAHGEKAVLRVIPRETEVPTLEGLGLLKESIATVHELARRPQGMIVVTGPTGCGKSTTLYTILKTLNETTRNIVTLEDPVEKKLPGISQGMIQPKAGFTFSSGLRAILRQDPNVIMVGEIRDVETAEIAMSAALTGHMLLTTLHTNSALGAVSRLLDMGLEPFLISSALTAVFAQRLARKLCEGCREAGTITDAERADLEELARRGGVKLGELKSAQIYRPKGCSSCRDTGYRGRLLIFELVKLTPKLRELILAKATIDEMRKTAVAEGSELLLSDGLKKAAAGLTSITEIARVVGADE
jgi:type II secretory ATPase GspE/PulE/Tfp pilus assembly ATPase PilB-like protein